MNLNVQSSQVFHQETNHLMTTTQLSYEPSHPIPVDVIKSILYTGSTKLQLTFSQCSKDSYNIVFKNSPTLILIRDLMQNAMKNKWRHVDLDEPEENRGGFRNMTYTRPSSNNFLMYPTYDNDSSVKNYVVTSIDDKSNFTPSFISDLNSLLIDCEKYKSDKRACERKFFYDLLKYYNKKKAFIVDIGLKKINKSTTDAEIVRIQKREFNQSDCSDICLKIFSFSGACTGDLKIDHPITKDLNSILKENKMMVKYSTVSSTEKPSNH